MWQAASIESSVASEVLKTILSILKGKPGEMEETLGEKRRFSLDASNMMPVAVSDAMAFLFCVVFLIMTLLLSARIKPRLLDTAPCDHASTHLSNTNSLGAKC